MMSQQLGPSVIAAPLAATDRRGLSQAWYSALHLTQAGAAPAGQLVEKTAPSNARWNEARTNAEESAQVPRVAVSRAASRGESATHATPANDRRAPRTALAARIERVLRTKRVPRPATLRAEGGRVQISLASHRGRCYVVALCAPELRERVARAIAQARYALAGRGIALCS